MLGSLLALTGATVLLAMVPGPATAVVIRQSLRDGRRAALLATLGNSTGLLFWSLAAAFGLSSLLAASQLAYDVMRLVGAAILVVLGVQSLRAARRGTRQDAAMPDRPGSDRGLGRSYRVGLVTALANPKVAVFALSFLPQFVPAGAPVLAMLLLCALVWVAVDTAWYTVVAWLVTRTKLALHRPRVRRRLEQMSGAALVGLGVRMAAESR